MRERLDDGSPSEDGLCVFFTINQMLRILGSDKQLSIALLDEKMEEDLLIKQQAGPRKDGNPWNLSHCGTKGVAWSENTVYLALKDERGLGVGNFIWKAIKGTHLKVLCPEEKTGQGGEDNIPYFVVVDLKMNGGFVEPLAGDLHPEDGTHAVTFVPGRNIFFDSAIYSERNRAQFMKRQFQQRASDGAIIGDGTLGRRRFIQIIRAYSLRLKDRTTGRLLPVPLLSKRKKEVTLSMSRRAAGMLEDETPADIERGARAVVGALVQITHHAWGIPLELRPAIRDFMDFEKLGLVGEFPNMTTAAAIGIDLLETEAKVIWLDFVDRSDKGVHERYRLTTVSAAKLRNETLSDLAERAKKLHDAQVLPGAKRKTNKVLTSAEFAKWWDYDNGAGQRGILPFLTHRAKAKIAEVEQLQEAEAKRAEAERAAAVAAAAGHVAANAAGAVAADGAVNAAGAAAAPVMERID